VAGFGKISERTKIAAVVGLSLVLLGTAYFRFFHKSDLFPGKTGPASAAVPVAAKTAAPAAAPPAGSAWPENAVSPASIRDIFSPLSRSSERKEAGSAEPGPGPVASWKLKGTILGGGPPIAVINEKFLREGENIGDYRIVRIKKNEVILKSGQEQIVLEVLPNAEK